MCRCDRITSTPRQAGQVAARSSKLVVVAFMAAAALAVSLLPHGSVWADSVEQRSTGRTLRGTIVAESREGIRIKTPAETVDVPVPDIAEVIYEGAAGAMLRMAEGIEQAGQLERARKRYESVLGMAKTGTFVQAAAEFGLARVRAKEALAGNSPLIDEAIAALNEFRLRHRDSRFHYELHELLAQLLTAKGDYEGARAAYQELAKAPWPAIKTRAAMGLGRILEAANQFEEAAKQYDQVIQRKLGTEQGRALQIEAMIQKAKCLARLNRQAEALKLAKAAIEAAPSDQLELQAKAHNLKGDLLVHAGQLQDALLAYLYVDLMCSRVRTERRYALEQIAQVSEKLGRPDLAQEAKKKLKGLTPKKPTAKITKTGSGR